MKNRNITPRTQLTSFAIQVGQLFRKGTTVFRISEDCGSYLRLEHVESLESKYIKTSDLATEYAHGQIVPCTNEEVTRAISGDVFEEDDVPPLATNTMFMYGEKASAYSRRILKYIAALRALGYESLRPCPLLELEVERIGRNTSDPAPPKASTIYKYSLAIERSGGDLRTAIPRYKDRGGRGKSRIAPEASDAISRCIERLKGKPHEQIGFTRIEREVFHNLLLKHGQEKAIAMMPSLTTISSIVKSEFGEYEICARKYGTTTAKRTFRSWSPRDRAIAPLQVVEFDDKDTRVFGIDQRTSLPCGRIYLTSGVDQYSAIPLGFSISDKARNTWSAINALSNAVLPNDLNNPDWAEVKSDVPYMGMMALIIFDNALYNHAKDLEESALDISNATIAWAKPFTPTEKSIIEDFNGRLTSDFLVTLPGFAGPKASREMLEHGVAAANLSVQDFKRYFHCWAYDVYANTPRAGGMTPKQKWESGMRERHIRLPIDIHRIRMATMLRHVVKFRPEGILFTGLIYNNQRLQILRKRVGDRAPVEFRYNPEHLAEVFVFDQQSHEWFQVPNVSPEYVRFLTLHQHKLIRKMATIDGKRNPAVPIMLEYRARLAKLVEQSRFSKKLKERRWSARVGSIHVAPSAIESEATITVTELEAQVMEIELAEMDTGDEGWEFPVL